MGVSNKPSAKFTTNKDWAVRCELLRKTLVSLYMESSIYKDLGVDPGVDFMVVKAAARAVIEESREWVRAAESDCKGSSDRP